MKVYPVMLDLRGRTCVVVGAGAVGLRKARALCRAGAKVRLVGPRVKRGTDLRGIERLRAAYAPRHLTGAALVFACTSDGRLNARIAADGRKLGAWVNVADCPRECDFFVPASLVRGRVTVAVSTGGDVPALSAALKRTLSVSLPRRLGGFAAALARLRRQLSRQVPDAARRRRILRRLAGPQGYNAFITGGSRALAVLARAPRKPP